MCIHTITIVISYIKQHQSPTTEQPQKHAQANPTRPQLKQHVTSTKTHITTNSEQQHMIKQNKNKAGKYKQTQTTTQHFYTLSYTT